MSDETMSNQEEGGEFMTRVSNMPFLGTAFRVYEHGKNSSSVIKFGAEMMEGTVKTMTRPVIDRLPMSQLDSFANRQLDRLGGTRFAAGSNRVDEASLAADYSLEATMSAPRSPDSSSGGGARGRKHLFLDDDEAAARRRSTSRDSVLSSGATASDTAFSASSGAHTRVHSDSQWHAIVQAQDQQRQIQDDGGQTSTGQEVQVVSRSKWQAVLLEAGGIGAAVSEESMKRLKYCLQWLQVCLYSLYSFFPSRDVN